MFKAYDIRARVSELTPAVAEIIGLGMAHELFVPEGRILVSRDMRTHSPALSAALIRGLRAGGCHVLDMGLASTPMHTWANATLGVDGSVQVTASHNGPEYNGFKVSGPDALPIDDISGLSAVNAFVESWHNPLPPVTGGQDALDNDALLSAYLDAMQAFVTPHGRPLKIAVDAGNGMAGHFLPGFFARNPHWTPVPLYWELDGTFPNHEADPLKPHNLLAVAQAVTEHGCDLGVAFDGDADRCVFIDDQGQTITSDLTTAYLAEHFLSQEPPGTPILYDVRSSQVVAETIRAAGGEPVLTRVGHSFMKRQLRQTGAPFGGELSGHFYFASLHHTDSALMALIEVLKGLGQQDQPFSAVMQPFARYARSGELNFQVPNPQERVDYLLSHPLPGTTLETVDGVTLRWPDASWCNVRASNTEPLLRLNCEAPHPQLLAERVRQITEYLAESQAHVVV